jgi:hypothetical protein
MSENATMRLSRATLLAIGMTALGRAIEIRGGQLGWAPGPYPAIAWLTLAIVMASLGVFLGKPIPITPPRFQLIVGLCLLANIVQFVTKTPDPLLGPYTFARFAPLSAGLAATAFLSGIVLVAEGRRRILAFSLLLVASACLGNWVICNCPDPFIDVYTFQNDSAAALASGRDPYPITFPDIYGTDPRYYAEGAAANGTLHFGYPYLPETLFAIMPAKFLHFDLRYAQLAAVLATAILIVVINPESFGFSAATLFVTTPTIYLVLEKSWVEPFTLVTLAATVACTVYRPRLLPLALGLFLASKQYLPAAALLFFVGARPVRQTVVFLSKAVVVALAVTLPLALWNLPAFFHSAIELQFRQPFRPDSLSYVAWMGQAFWPKDAIVAIPFTLLFASMGLVLWRRKNTGFAAAVAFCFLLFFAFSKQAFANYYFFIIGAMACAIAELHTPASLAHPQSQAQPIRQR